MEAPRRGCDVCGANERRLLHEQRFVTFDDDAGLSGYDVVSCETCGFVYADGLPEMSVFERYYRELSKYDPDADGKPLPAYRRRNYEQIVEQISLRLPNRAARILDVGSASGELLVAFRECGYTDLTGLDPSPRCAEIARSRHGLRVLNTTISQLEESRERYDLILLGGVLEHVRDLRSMLLKLKTLLRADGHFWFGVPDAARLTEEMTSPYQHLSLEHINFFTERSLTSALGGVGMRPAGLWKTTHYVGAMAEPTLNGLFVSTGVERKVVPDEIGAIEVARYIVRSRLIQADLEPKLRALSVRGERVVVWGLGSLTMLLLSDDNFAALEIIAFIDANRNYWGKTIRGIPVKSPACVQRYEETILVCSFSYEAEIVSYIRDRQLPNEVIGLFGTGERVV